MQVQALDWMADDRRLGTVVSVFVFAELNRVWTSVDVWFRCPSIASGGRAMEVMYWDHASTEVTFVVYLQLRVRIRNKAPADIHRKFQLATSPSRFVVG